MKILVKPIAILLLGAYSFALGQDVYPYFSDTKKQFEFEKKRIYIRETSEKEQIISGGSEFNIFYLFDDSQPAIVPSDILTSYRYIYTFEIIQYNNFLSEIEFLRLIGLNEEAKEIIDDYIKRINIWEKILPQKVITYHPVLGVDSYKYQKFWGAIFILTGVGAVLSIGDERENEDNALRFLAAILCFAIGIGAPEKPKFAKPPKPVLKQTLTSEQIKSLSESYNKRIYEEIKLKPIQH